MLALSKRSMVPDRWAAAETLVMLALAPAFKAARCRCGRRVRLAIEHGAPPGFQERDPRLQSATRAGRDLENGGSGPGLIEVPAR